MDWDTFKQNLTPIEKPLVEFYRSLVEIAGTREVLEIGSGWGLFTRSALEAGPAVEVTTIDKIPIERLTEFNKNTAGFENRIERIEADSRKLLPQVIAGGKRQFGLIFVDGNHGEGAPFEDMKNAWKLLRPGGILMVDDVFHAHNYDEGYTVAEDLWEFIRGLSEAEINPQSFSVQVVGHGVAVISKSA